LTIGGEDNSSADVRMVPLYFKIDSIEGGSERGRRQTVRKNNAAGKRFAHWTEVNQMVQSYFRMATAEFPALGGDGFNNSIPFHTDWRPPQPQKTDSLYFLLLFAFRFFWFDTSLLLPKIATVNGDTVSTFAQLLFSVEATTACCVALPAHPLNVLTQILLVLALLIPIILIILIAKNHNVIRTSQERERERETRR
jgi:hypothetical protein